MNASTTPKTLTRGKRDVALSAYALLFSELVQYHKSRAKDTSELERALEDAGVVGDDREARARTREDGRRRGIDRDAARR